MAGKKAKAAKTVAGWPKLSDAVNETFRMQLETLQRLADELEARDDLRGAAEAVRSQHRVLQSLEKDEAFLVTRKLELVGLTKRMLQQCATESKDGLSVTIRADDFERFLESLTI